MPLPDEAPSASPVRLTSIALVILCFLVLGLAAVFASRSRSTPELQVAVTQVTQHHTFADLTTMSVEDLQAMDIALLNLRCAEGLPGSDALDINASLKTLDHWADRVEFETQRHVGKFYANPSDFNDSLAFYQMLMLVTVLQKDFGVHYDSDLIRKVEFSDSESLFVHGMLNSKGGTCVSMPVLYTAVARRLGYPVFLVNAKEHVYCRWDSPSERFNVEGTNHGMNSHDDAHYMQWPHPIAQSEVTRGTYLKSLTMAESFAAFLATRGHCFKDNGNMPDARRSYRMAVAYAPQQPMYQTFLRQISRPLRIEDFPELVRQQEQALKRLRDPNYGMPPQMGRSTTTQPPPYSSPGHLGFQF